MKKIVIASDHAGYYLKEYVKKFLNRKKLKIKDVGANSNEKVDYPDFDSYEYGDYTEISKTFSRLILISEFEQHFLFEFETGITSLFKILQKKEQRELVIENVFDIEFKEHNKFDIIINQKKCEGMIKFGK